MQDTKRCFPIKAASSPPSRDDNEKRSIHMVPKECRTSQVNESHAPQHHLPLPMHTSSTVPHQLPAVAKTERLSPTGVFPYTFPQNKMSLHSTVASVVDKVKVPRCNAVTHHPPLMALSSPSVLTPQISPTHPMNGLTVRPFLIAPEIMAAGMPIPKDMLLRHLQYRPPIHAISSTTTATLNRPISPDANIPTSKSPPLSSLRGTMNMSKRKITDDVGIHPLDLSSSCKKVKYQSGSSSNEEQSAVSRLQQHKHPATSPLQSGGHLVRNTPSKENGHLNATRNYSFPQSSSGGNISHSEQEKPISPHSDKKARVGRRHSGPSPLKVITSLDSVILLVQLIFMIK